MIFFSSCFFFYLGFYFILVCFFRNHTGLLNKNCLCALLHFGVKHIFQEANRSLTSHQRVKSSHPKRINKEASNTITFFCTCFTCDKGQLHVLFCLCAPHTSEHPNWIDAGTVFPCPQCGMVWCDACHILTQPKWHSP